MTRNFGIKDVKGTLFDIFFLVKYNLFNAKTTVINL